MQNENATTAVLFDARWLRRIMRQYTKGKGCALPWSMGQGRFTRRAVIGFVAWGRDCDGCTISELYFCLPEKKDEVASKMMEYADGPLFISDLNNKREAIEAIRFHREH